MFVNKHILMKHLLLFLFVTLNVFVQKTFVVKDLATKEPIAYTSIYAADGSFKINSEEDGSFTVPNEFLEKTFVFDAVGYEIKQQQLVDVIFLESKSEVLDEVVIIPMKRTKTLRIGQIKNSNFSYCSNAEVESWSFGRYFPYEKNMGETPFLKEIRFDLMSEKKSSTYGIRIYEVDKDGFPQRLLHDELIIGKAKKGNKISITDVSKLKITIPKEGVLVVFEWINIKENYYEYISTYKGKRYVGKSYNPCLKTMPTNTFEFSLMKNDNDTKSWRFVTKENHFFRSENDSKPYGIISCEIILTN